MAKSMSEGERLLALDHMGDDCQCERLQCSRCKSTKCCGHFNSSNTVTRGFSYLCRECEHAKDKVWRQRNSEYHAQRTKDWREAHPERMKELRESWRQENRETRRQKNREEYRKKPDYHREKRAKWNRENPKRRTELSIVQTHRRRLREKQAEGHYTLRQWEDLKAKYGYICLCCKRQEPKIKLTADHVIPLVKGGSNSIDNLQPLCISCNRSKGTKTTDYRVNEEAG